MNRNNRGIRFGSVCEALEIALAGAKANATRIAKALGDMTEKCEALEKENAELQATIDQYGHGLTTEAQEHSKTAAERDRLKAEVEAWNASYHAANNERIQLKAEVEALRKDVATRVV